jgi:hypothetical protein
MTGSPIAEHARLEALLRAVAAACAAGGAGDAQTACDRLGVGLEAHLDREESLYFPPISALRPDRRGALERLLEDHREIRSALARLQGRLAERDLADGERALAVLARRLADHEADEEAFLDALDADLRETAQGLATP